MIAPLSRLQLGAAAALFLAVAPAAQEACPACDGQGLVPCSRHADLHGDAGAGDWLCTAIRDCPDCQGLGVVECPDCETAPAGLSARRQRLAALLGAHDADTALLGEHAVSMDGAGLRVSVCVGRRVRVARRTVPAHAFAHRVADLVATARDEFRAAFRLRDAGDVAGMAATPNLDIHLVLLADAAMARRAAIEHTGNDLHQLAVLGTPPRATAVARLDVDLLGDDAALSGLVGYLAGRLLLTRALVASPGAAGHGWVEAGVAHWSERRLAGDNRLLGHGEQVSTPYWSLGGGDWPAAARRLAEADLLPPLAALTQRQHEQLDLDDNAMSMMLLQGLLDAGRGPNLLRSLRRALADEGEDDVLHQSLPPGEDDAERWFRAVLRRE